MSDAIYDYDFIVIGSGPAGQKAAIQAAKAGQHVAIVELDSLFGGACVHKGTIPSKTLRENAQRINSMRQNARLVDFELNENLEVITLLARLDEVFKSHNEMLREQIERNHIERIHARARFVDDHTLSLIIIGGEAETVTAKNIIIATGSSPLLPDNIPADHEHVFDTDSILSMMYLPESLMVVGSGVTACEFATIFQALGVKVTMLDQTARPLPFLDVDMTDAFIKAFEAMGGQWIANEKVERVEWADGKVISKCRSGTVVRAEKLLYAAGRQANVNGLDLDKAGLSLDENGVIPVNAQLQTTVSHIYAAGDVIGPPSLASTSMEQGRRAVRNALGLATEASSQLTPSGIYSIPELSSVGMTEAEARAVYGDVLIGRASFAEVARGVISGNTAGMLKLITDKQGKKLLGVAVIGEGATELVHLGQVAMLTDADVDIFVDNTFNFPTLAEAYRIAALDILAQRPQ